MKIRVAFIKFGGLSTGGTERWLQMMAANLPRKRFVVDFYYCDSAPYIGSDWTHPDTDPQRLKFMLDHGVNLRKFHVGFKDLTTETHQWVDTDFREIFDETLYDLIQCAKAGPMEYPFYLINKPVVEYVTLLAGVDLSPNIAWSIHLSQWQRIRWAKWGGNLSKSSVIPIPSYPPASEENLREELGIPPGAVVMGFHQRVDNNIASPVPLTAFSRLRNIKDCWFIIMGGGDFYRKLAGRLSIENIHFLGHSGDSLRISKFLNTLDIFAHGRADGETYGTVLAEALIHGKPCISHLSTFGANAQPETMGPSGLFAMDVDDYTEKLQTLVEDKQYRKKLAAKALPHAETYFNLQSAVRNLTGVYKKVLGLESKKSKKNQIPYYYSRYGFLYSTTEPEKTNSFKHILADNISDEFPLMAAVFLLKEVDTVVDVAAEGSFYFALAASKNKKVHVFETNAKALSCLNETIRLNNWEDTVQVHGSTDDLTDISNIGFMKVKNDKAGLMVIDKAEVILMKHKPVFFIEPSFEPLMDVLISTLIKIQDFGYNIYEADERSLSYRKFNCTNIHSLSNTIMCINKQSGLMRELHLRAFKEKTIRNTKLTIKNLAEKLLKIPISRDLKERLYPIWTKLRF
ncbi:MAG: glycosyltransferase family 4 protein [Nitrospirae bacterium YQR-1]